VGRYENYLSKPLGNQTASDITTYDIYQILEAVAQSGSYQTAEKLSYIINGCMTQAAVLGLIPVNPAVGVMSQVSKTTKSEQMPHFNLTKKEDEARFAKFLNDIEHIKQSSIVVKTALLLSPHLFMRSGSLVSLKVSDFDQENKMLVIPAENMKSKHSDFIVPLSNQAFELLDNLLTVTNPDV
jgi:integrase